MSSNQPHSKPAKRRCLYEILDVARTATESEIRAAYKIQAKKWHPDRNYGNAEEAEHMFKEINAAYEVLMDKNERAWYNAHREHILRGEKANENTNDMDLVPYFSVWAFSGFDVNDENNFYSVYSKLFDEIVELEGLSKKKTPQFGTFNTKWNKIDRFYNYWENFHCRRKFDWKSVYNLNSAQNRYIRKQMEKENKKIISQAKREWEDTVIKLVLFVKKRDPRYRNHLVEMEQERLKQEQIEKEREYEEQLLLKEERRKEKEIEYEKILKEIENDEKFNESMFIEHEFQCIVCNKTFKSEKSFKNHERSKKHLKALERLKQELSLEDELFIQNDNNNNNNNNNNNDTNNNDDNVDKDDDNGDNNEGNIENENESENESNNENENENENEDEPEHSKGINENLAKSKDNASDIDFLLASQMQAQFDKLNIGHDSNNESDDDDNDDNDENAQTIVKNILENIINEIVNECDSNNNNNNNKTNSSINGKTVETMIENTGNDTNVTNENKNDNSNENESDTDSEEAKMKEFLNSFKKGKNNQNKASLSKQNLKANKKDKKKRRRRKDKNDDNNNDSEMIENLEKLNDSQSILREYHKQNALNKKKGKNSSNSSINSKNNNESAQRSYCRACNRPFPSKSKLFKHLKEFPQHSLVSNAGAFSKDNKAAN